MNTHRGLGRWRRFLALAMVALASVAALADPYLWHFNASDIGLPPPIWQRGLGMLDVAWLLVLLPYVWKGINRRALSLLLLETLYWVGVNLLYVERDGIARFEHGFGGEQYLSLYLTTLAVRVAAALAMI